jgi:hypothetical protein
MVRTDQSYFYSKEWQEGETQTDNDIEKGDLLGPFKTSPTA